MSTAYDRNTSATDDLALLLGDATTPRVVRTAAAHGIRLAEDGTEYVEQPADPGLPPLPDDDEEEDGEDPARAAATHVRLPEYSLEVNGQPAVLPPPPLPEEGIEYVDPTHVRLPAEVIEGRANQPAARGRRHARTAAALNPATALL